MAETNGDSRTGKLIGDAIAIRSARAVDDHIKSIQSAHRLALEQAQDDMAKMREDMIEMQRESVRAQQQLIEQMTELLRQFKTFAQRVATVQSVSAEPSPAPPRRATINHSDGTQSTVEFRDFSRN